MKKLRILGPLGLLLLALVFCPPAGAKARHHSPTRHTHRRRNQRQTKHPRGSCHCQGCGLITQGLKPEVLRLYQTAAKSGVRAISCIRPQWCQDRLRRCYENSCGQYGRAARISNHRDGRACDFRRSNTGALDAIKRKYHIRTYRLLHPMRQGGGVHESTNGR